MSETGATGSGKLDNLDTRKSIVVDIARFRHDGKLHVNRGLIYMRPYVCDKCYYFTFKMLCLQIQDQLTPSLN